MTISRRTLGWFSSLVQAALVVALVPAAGAWADCPGDSCDDCKSRVLQTVDWTAIYLGDFATGCALANPYPPHEYTIGCEQSTLVTGAWCPGPSVLAHDPCTILPSAQEWGLRIDGSAVSLSVDSLSAFGATPLDCPCNDGADRDQFNFNTVHWVPAAKHEVSKEKEAEGDESPLQLKPGEAAQEILELARRLGPGPLHGTIFDDEPPTVGVPVPGMDRCFRAHRNGESLARAIRSLEAQDRRQRDASATIEAMFEDSAEQEPLRPTDAFDRVEPIEKPSAMLPGTPQRIDALRQAGRMLEESANLLEEQGLYDRADELRGMAQQLREDARDAKARRLEPVQYRDSRPEVRYWGIDTPHVVPPRR